jgi:Tol biopolymer transport system component
MGGAALAGTVNSGGTILFSRQNHWYTIAPNGTHLRMLLSDTAGCPSFGCAAFSPDGTRVMVAAQSANTMQVATAVISTTGSGYHLLPLPDARLNLGPGAWTPNGSRMALDGWGDSNKTRAGIYVVNASDGKGLTRLTTSPDGRHDDALAYSPDGSRLLFFHEGLRASRDPDFGDLLTATATRAGRVRLNPPGTEVAGAWGAGSWSPDGKQIAFTAYDNTNSGESAVFVVGANGSNRHRITAWGKWMTSAHWSSVGNWIEFDKGGVGTAHNLYLIHPNGTGVKQITFSSLDGLCCAVWSPDGKKLLTVQQDDRYLVTMNWNGSGIRRLTHADMSSSNAEYAWGR